MIVCKVCGHQNEPGAQFCGNCGSFLEWTGESTTPPTPPPTPDGTDTTGGTAPTQPDTTVVATPEPIPPDAIICRVCGTANEPDRVFCKRCASELASQLPPVPVVPDGGMGPTGGAGWSGGGALPPPPGTQTGGLPIPAPVLAGAALVAVVAVAVAFIAFGPRSEPTSSLGPGPTATASTATSSSPPPSSPPPSASPTESPAPTPTGQLLVTVVVEGGEDRIAIMDWDGQNFRTLERGNVISPAWSPDHTKYVYVRDGGLVVANRDGGGDKRITPAGSRDALPKWSPDGEWIAFSRGPAGQEDVWKIPAGGGKAVNLTDRNGEDRGPSWSPDSQRIAYVSRRGENREIYVMDADGDGATNLTDDPANDVDPAWSPDGAEILYATNKDESTLFLWYLDVETGEKRRAVEPTAEPDHDAVWSPDGQFIAFHRGVQGRWIVIATRAGEQVIEIKRASLLRLPSW